MERRAIAALLLVAFSPFLVAGTGYYLWQRVNRHSETKHSNIDRFAIASCLPPGITFQDRIKWEGKERTLEDVLEELSATCREGKIYDASGNELYFFEFSRPGQRNRNEEARWQRRHEEELEKLRRVYRVIEVNRSKE